MLISTWGSCKVADKSKRSFKVRIMTVLVTMCDSCKFASGSEHGFKAVVLLQPCWL